MTLPLTFNRRYESTQDGRSSSRLYLFITLFTPLLGMVFCSLTTHAPIDVFYLGSWLVGLKVLLSAIPKPLPICCSLVEFLECFNGLVIA